MEQELSESHSDYEKVKTLTAELQKLSEELDTKSIRWMEIQEQM